MYKFLVLTALLAFTALVFTGCPGNATNGNMNSNRMMNSNMNSMNSMNSNMSNGNMMNSNMSNSNKEVSSADDKFMTEAAQGGMMEVKMGELAASKAANADVKAFGKQMVEDHGKANADLKALAGKKGVELPADMTGGQKADYDRLSKLSGAEFDKEYVDMMVKDHDEDTEAFQDQAEDAENADLKAFAAKYAPVIKSHYDKIKAIQDKMK